MLGEHSERLLEPGDAMERLDKEPSTGSELASSGGAGVSAVVAAGGAAPPQPPPPLALKDVQCPICLKVFSRKFSLEMHFLIHQGLKPYKCQFCGRCFRQKGTLMRHKAIHSQTPSYRCGLCDKSYRQKNVFLHHLRNRHKVSTDVLDRRRCHIKNNAGGGVMEAVPAAPLPPPSLSSVCLPPLSPPEPPPGEAAPPVMLRISERQQALPPSSAASSMWQCPFCAFESAHDPEICRSHLLQHVGEPADCPLCPRQLASPQELAAHLRDFHESAGLAPILTNPAVATAGRPPDVTFTCIPCQMEFSSEEDFEWHVRTHVQSVLSEPPVAAPRPPLPPSTSTSEGPLDLTEARPAAAPPFSAPLPIKSEAETSRSLSSPPRFPVQAGAAATAAAAAPSAPVCRVREAVWLQGALPVPRAAALGCPGGDIQVPAVPAAVLPQGGAAGTHAAAPPAAPAMPSVRPPVQLPVPAAGAHSPVPGSADALHPRSGCAGGAWCTRCQPPRRHPSGGA
ncbi:zinc finger protein 865 isoform X2 [Dermacentor silvarum]|uniref:zinc finger protein 865 isoform X2 n=1 Tax=Dermacentor silvarum TaxID=543639 RepID=UPI002101463A|nr:zinc finger protein 865 isoform X2 [Dermacentor silvarum]